MKIGVNHPRSILLYFVLAIIIAAQAFGDVSIVGDWEGTIGGTSHTHTAESGTDRALIFIAHGEMDGTMNCAEVYYGGQEMTKVVDRNYTYTIDAYVAAYILDEAGIAAATSDTFSITWDTNPTEIKYASVFLENVNQSTLTGASATAGNANTNTISTSALATSDGDMVILGATCGNSGSYTMNSGFTEGIDQSAGSSTGAAGYKSATGAAETPSVTHSGSNRQALIGFVVQGAIPDPNIATNPNPSNGASGVSPSADLSWDAPTAYTPTSYDVYFGTDTNAHNNPQYTVYTESFDPAGDLEYGTTYYWVVDSNNSGTIYSGFEWSFTTFVISDRAVGNMMLINDNGGWCWYQDDKIVYDPVGGNVLTSTAGHPSGFGGVGGTRGSEMDATTFNISTGKRTRTVASTDAGDDHDMGAFWIRPDGRYLHMYAPHYSGSGLTYYRLATYPNDGSAWGSQQNYDWDTISGISGGTLSYTNVHYLSSEGTGNGRLYNIVRWNEVTPNISYSDDWGVTWQYMGRLNSPVGGETYSNFYHKFRGNGVDRIDFIGVEQHPRNYNNSVFHGYIKNGKGYDSYGSVVDDNLFDTTAPSIQAYTPVFIADANQDPGTYHSGWSNEMEIDKDGYPVCLYQTRYGTEEWGNGSGQNTIGAADHRFFYARFDGSTWTSTELCKMGPGLHLPEQDYLPMGCIHPDDANVVYIGTPFDPRDDSPLEHIEIFKGVTPDRGLTWNWTQMTFDSTEDNIRPAIPPWDANNTAVFWTRGIYPGQENYDFVVVGIVEQESVNLGKVSYIDADEINTTESDDSAFTPTGPSGSAGAADDQWHEYTGYGNGGSCYTAGDGGTEDAPRIKTTISGLADGTYDVFAYFWSDPEQDWGIRGGFETSDMLCFSKQSSQFADSSQFSGSVETVGSGVQLYRVYIGRKEITGGASIEVYLDNYDSTYNSNAPTRTTYDGVGVASVISGCMPGDLNCNGKVNFVDFAILGEGWLDIYDYDTLADLADNWLFGI